MMRSASREALANLQAAQESALGSGASAADYTQLAEQLYAIAGLLTAQPRLRRAVADPSTAAEGRAEFIGRLLSDRVGAAAVGFVAAAVRGRWSSPWDLVDAIELSANDALFAAAEQQGALDDVEDELFRFERILDGEPELATLLDEVSVAAGRRVALLDQILGGKVHPVTQALLEQAVTSGRKRSLAFAIDDLLEQAAARQQRSVARVIAAAELTAEQHNRLEAALTALYGRPISLRTAIDPAVQGGLVIRIGDEVIDGSVAARLNMARAGLAG